VRGSTAAPRRPSGNYLHVGWFGLDQAGRAIDHHDLNQPGVRGMNQETPFAARLGRGPLTGWVLRHVVW